MAGSSCGRRRVVVVAVVARVVAAVEVVVEVFVLVNG